MCSLLLAKADGLIGHEGDRSVLNKKDVAAAPTVRELHEPAAPRPVPRMDGTGTRVAARVPPPPVPTKAPRRTTAVTDSLRQALVSYLEETCAEAAEAPVEQLLHRLDRARSLARSIAEFTDAHG